MIILIIKIPIGCAV